MGECDYGRLEKRCTSTVHLPLSRLWWWVFDTQYKLCTQLCDTPAWVSHTWILAASQDREITCHTITHLARPKVVRLCPVRDSTGQSASCEELLRCGMDGCHIWFVLNNNGGSSIRTGGYFFMDRRANNNNNTITGRLFLMENMFSLLFGQRLIDRCFTQSAAKCVFFKVPALFQMVS